MKEYLAPFLACAGFLCIGVLIGYNEGKRNSNCNLSRVKSINTDSSKVTIILDNGISLIINTK